MNNYDSIYMESLYPQLPLWNLITHQTKKNMMFINSNEVPPCKAIFSINLIQGILKKNILGISCIFKIQ